MAPKVNDKGGKSINIVSKQTNRSLHISTPLMMTWGIADFIDEKGESDGKYSISLNFPNDEYRTQASDEFLSKLKEFETQILQEAVKNSELWWGESMSLELCKHTFFPFLKYTKNKDTKKIDMTKPPSIRAKVPNYNGKWGVEIYDTSSRLIFPCEDEHMMPMDFVPKLSRVACGLQCSGIWIGGKGWGLTWKMFQCIVKPREVVSVFGKCHIALSNEEKDTLEKQVILDDVTAEEMVDSGKGLLGTEASSLLTLEATKSPPKLGVVPQVTPKPTVSTVVEDSDGEDDEVPVPVPVKEVVPVPEVPEASVVTPVQEDATVSKKKVIKKKAV